ncbi:MAG TPA: carboxypeptidase regulatory-like domain-containing protein [Candidatus Sulfotelmatobacter sp.]|nr:carboxypeptidase regulatory-like domain-containing protein [Candidatus Sulfotelmatobacter sp.]
MAGVCLASLLIVSPLFSQGNLGRITGTITDQSGGAIAGATVTVLDVQRGVSRTLTTGDSGEYNAPNLLPGSYSVRAEAKGFKKVEQQNILLEVGKEIRVDLSLQPGEISQTITITEAPPMVETTNATLGGTISNETINDLPLNGRNYINLLSLRPGMNVYAGGGSFTRSANGTRAEDIGYLLDGLRNDDPLTGSSVLNAAIPAGDSSTSLPIDAIQEFNTEQNPKAEFGWKPGAIVNAGIKSGTNTIHGTAFAFGRDTALDARNFFDPAPIPKAAIGLEQFGASFGGAIKKDKLFYFVNYEGQRYSVADTLIETPPVTCAGGAPGCGVTVNNPTLSLVDACNAVGFANVTPLSARIAGLNSDCSVKPTSYTPGASESLFPTNPGSGNPITPNSEILGMVSNSKQDNGVAKVDYHMNDHHSFSGTYFRGVGGGSWHDQAWEVGVPGSGNSPWISQLWGYIQTGSGAWTWTPTSTLVNEFRVGYSYYSQPSVSNDSTVNPLAYGIDTGVTDPRRFGFPLIQINQLNGATFKLGGNWPKYNGPDGSLQILEHVAILRGKHAFKFGGEIIRDSSDPFITMNAKGLIKFRSLQDFLTGTVNPAGGSLIQAGDPQRYLHDYSYAGFVQDDWRVTPKLMLNLGVRYELTTVLKDRNNQLGNYDPNSATGFAQVGIGGFTAPFHGDHNNFSPRVGFAWDVRGDGKTVIRGGGSVMYEQIPIISLIAVGNQLGLNQIPTGAQEIFYAGDLTGSPGTGTLNKISGPGNMGALNVGVSSGLLSAGWQAQTAACVSGGTTACGSIFPQSIFQLTCGDGSLFGNPAPCNIEAVDPNMRTPYISTWTLTIQRAITNDLSLEVAYVGNHGTKLLGFRNINQPPLGASYPGFGSADPMVNEVLSCNTAGNPGGFACDPQNDAGGASAVQPFRPYFNKFPYIGEIDRLSNQDASNYNGLQVTLTQRPTHGVSFLAGYTYSHAFDTGSNNFNDIQLPPDSSHPTRGIYGQSLFDIRHRFTLSTTYAIPGIKRLGQLLQGWEINSVVTLQSASPWGVQDFTNDFSGTNQVNELDTFGQTWNFVGNDADFKAGRATPIPCWSGSSSSTIPGCPIGAPGSGANTIQPAAPAACMSAATALGAGAVNILNSVGCYFAGNSVLIPPALGTVGSARRNIFPDLGFRNWDLSVVKDTRIKERLTAQFRVEFFNILNHANFSDPNGPANAGFNDPSTGNTGNFGCACNTPDQAAPNPVLGTGGARSIQLGLKLIF